MARKDEDINLEFNIPRNYKEKSVTISGLSYRNITEAVILVGIIIAILWFVPSSTMSFNTKLVVGLITGIPIGALAVKGINQCSLSEYLTYFIKYKLNPPRYIKKPLSKYLKKDI